MTALILGRRRQGKSTLALALGIAMHRRVVVWDPNGQYRRFPMVRSPEDLSDALLTDEEPVLVFRPRPGALEEDFSGFAGMLWPQTRSLPSWMEYTLIIDECSAIQSPSYIHPELERILRLAPPDISLIQTTHRLVDTHRLSRALSTDFFFFQTSSGHDLTMIQQDLESEALARAVAVLSIYQCAHYTIASGGERKFWIWKNGTDWFVELEEGENAGRDSKRRSAEYASEPA